jgi:hypothetical protein
MPFTCNFRGECEEWSGGKYATREECEIICASAEYKDLLYELNAYNPESCGY